MTEIVKATFEDKVVSFREDGWFNATEAAAKFGRIPNDWLRLPDAKAYIGALERKYGKISYYQTKRGRNGGTWMHPKLGVVFARWLNIDFALWCDEQIDNILRGKIDAKRMRHEAAASFKVMQDMLHDVRNGNGKITKPYHYSNEARLINYALTGEFGRVDRDTLPAHELDALALLEKKNTVLLGRGVDYKDRKKMLEQYALDLRASKEIAA
jgi:hypothetical protein